MTLESVHETLDQEQRSNRETIQRMVSSQENVAQFNIELDNLRLVSYSLFDWPVEQLGRPSLSFV